MLPCRVFHKVLTQLIEGFWTNTLLLYAHVCFWDTHFPVVRWACKIFLPNYQPPLPQLTHNQLERNRKQWILITEYWFILKYNRYKKSEFSDLPGVSTTLDFPQLLNILEKRLKFNINTWSNKVQKILWMI